MISTIHQIKTVAIRTPLLHKNEHKELFVLRTETNKPLSKEYIKMMLWKSVIAIPITISGLEFVLPNIQHYHTSVNTWYVLLSLVTLLIMGLATLSSQTFKIASANPAKTLK